MLGSNRQIALRETVARSLVLGIAFWGTGAASGQSTAPSPNPPPRSLQASGASTAADSRVSLAAVIHEAERNNPQILAAVHAWRAATQIPSQVSTPPDPQFTVQQFSVGSPRPFAGYTNSNFAYIGFGASQDIPYPGKLRLRGEVAQRDADAERDRYESTRRSVIALVKAAYFQLAYEYQELELLDRDAKLLDQVEKIAEAHYRAGQGNQQDILKAQLERTKLLREVELHDRERLSLQARLRQLLNRTSGPPDILPEALTETAVHRTVDELLGTIRTQNPEIEGQQQMVRSKGLQLEIAHKDFYPDFNVQYMWQHTSDKFPDYYSLSIGVRVPIHRSRRQWPEVYQATEELNQSRREYEAQVQQAYFDVRDQFLRAETAARILTIYREGLIPQAANTFQAGLAAYESSREDFETLLNSYLDVLRLDEEYWRSLLDHEMALARLEQVSGIDLDEANR